MSPHVMPVQTMLDEVERLLIAERRLTGIKNEALAAVAADLRARLPEAPTAAIVDMQERIAALLRTKSRTGYDMHALHFVGEGAAKHWHTIKRALERFKAEVEA